MGVHHGPGPPTGAAPGEGRKRVNVSTWPGRFYVAIVAFRSFEPARGVHGSLTPQPGMSAGAGLSKAAAARMRQDAEHEELMGGAAALRARID